MALEVPGFANGLCTANADLRTHQFKFMKVAADFKVDLNTTANGNCIGVLQDKPNTAEPANVMIDGISKLKLGGTVAFGGDIASSATGLGVAATGAGTVVLAVALEAGVINDVVTVQLIRSTKTA